MELLAFGGANLVWNPRAARDDLLSISAAHDHHGDCTLFANITARRKWNPCRGSRGPVAVGGRRRDESYGVARKTFEARAHNLQEDGYNSATETGDRNISAATEFRRNVSRLATEGGGIVDRETPQPGDMFIAPRRTGRVRGLRAARTGFDEAAIANTNLRHSHQKPAENVGAGAPSSTLTSIAQAAIPLLLIAPVMGFLARCVVDYIHAQIEDAVGRRFAEMESWQARHRPRVKRWQTILDEDRDEDDELELLTASAIPEYQYQSDPWSRSSHQATTSGDVTEMGTWHQIPSEETEEERKLRQKYDYEELKRSYTRLEPMYEKFLADSGLTGSGYWRGAGES